MTQQEINGAIELMENQRQYDASVPLQATLTPYTNRGSVAAIIFIQFYPLKIRNMHGCRLNKNANTCQLVLAITVNIVRYNCGPPYTILVGFSSLRRRAADTVLCRKLQQRKICVVLKSLQLRKPLLKSVI